MAALWERPDNVINEKVRDVIMLEERFTLDGVSEFSDTSAPNHSDPLKHFYPFFNEQKCHFRGAEESILKETEGAEVIEAGLVRVHVSEPQIYYV